MSSLFVKIHRKAEAELQALALSPSQDDQAAAALLLVLVELLKNCPAVRDHIHAHFQSIEIFKEGNTVDRVDIKIIQELKDIADDQKYHQDSIRRIRDLEHALATDYRLFFATRKLTVGISAGRHYLHVLGVFKRNVAYTKATLTELSDRYRNP